MCAAGDHIKITASKFPFPTVCNDKQSTDWFHSISRTFKWNERERQKSFVMVEEDAPSGPQNQGTSGKPKSSPLSHSTTQQEGHGDDDEEEEEEEKYDIDDSSPEAATAKANVSAPPVAPAAVAARAIDKDGIIESHFTHKSGYDSPDRFRVPYPHPPKVHFRHLVDGSEIPGAEAESSGSGAGSAENLKTPRPGDHRNEVHPGAAAAKVGAGPEDGRPHSAGVQQHHHHSPHYPHHQHHRGDIPKPATAPPERRAFAVWGQDESDSNTSDGEF
jgi:NAD+ kinase